jgi:hypothetical protein
MPDAALIDSLTDVYSKYRSFIKYGGDMTEFEECRHTLDDLLIELNVRLGRNDELHQFDERPNTSEQTRCRT